jgi:glycosyltransferase involved in cell wall biosynthesis
VKRLLIVTETGDARPSGRIRAHMYRELLAADGIDVRYASRFPPGLVRFLDQPGRLASRLLAAGLGRVLTTVNGRLGRHREKGIVQQARDRDVVYLQKVSSAPLIQALRRETGARLLYDLQDAQWLPFRSGDGGRALGDALRMVDAVTCDNQYGIEFARQYNPACYIVPDPARVELFDGSRERIRPASGATVLGWIGSPSSAFNLYAIWEALEALFSRRDDLTLRLVGVGHDRMLLPRFERVRYTAVPFYSEREMVQEVLAMDIGLFPMFDVEDSLARGIGKALVYMSGEAAVVASPIGDTRRLIRDGENGGSGSRAPASRRLARSTAWSAATCD